MSIWHADGPRAYLDQMRAKTWRPPTGGREAIEREVIRLNHYRAALAGRHIAIVSAGSSNPAAVARLLLLREDHSLPAKPNSEIGG